MSPLDDELRAALHGRARTVSPSPDPVAGVERRAAGLRRRRAATAVVGSALAVSALALGVPALVDAGSPAPRGPVVASAQPTPAPATPFALDPQDPWDYRGDPAVLEDGFPEAVAREVASRRGVAESAVELTPLHGQVYEPSAQPELVWLADVAGELSWGVAQASEAGPELVWDEPLPDPALALAAALPGDEVARLLVVADPATGQAQYGPDAASEFADAFELAPGVHVSPLEGDQVTDSYRVLDDAGEVVVREDAPDPVGGGGEPENLLSWPVRGTADAELEARVVELFQQAVEGQDGEPVDTGVAYRPLFTGDTDSGVRFTLGQAFVAGRLAQTVALALGTTEGEQFFLGPVTEPEAPVLATVVCCLPGTSTDLLVVVPQPGTGQVLYAEDGESYRPVGEGQDYLDGVVLVDRSTRPGPDRLQLLDGDGDLDAPTFDGAVADLLCGVRECG